jgi:L-asparagine transporter-like permease
MTLETPRKSIPRAIRSVQMRIQMAPDRKFLMMLSLYTFQKEEEEEGMRSCWG